MTTMTMIEAVRSALHDALASDERVLVFGEEVVDEGGVFGATRGLGEAFGAERVFDLPVGEAGIVGTAIGLAMAGMRPVPEITFGDDLFASFEQITNELAKLRYRSGGRFSSPVVLRASIGAGIHGGPNLSQSPEAYFTQTPGLQVVVPSTAADAYGLLIAAIRGEDPVLFLEPKSLYHPVRDAVSKEEIVSIGSARIAREGTDVSLVTWGAMVPLALEAAAAASEESGWSVEVIDLRTLAPLDTPTLLASVEKTGRAVILHEAPRTGGFGAEVAAQIAEQAIEFLEAPILRVTGADTPVPFAFEDDYRPDMGRLQAALRHVVEF